MPVEKLKRKPIRNTKITSGKRTVFRWRNHPWACALIAGGQAYAEQYDGNIWANGGWHKAVKAYIKLIPADIWASLVERFGDKNRAYKLMYDRIHKGFYTNNVKDGLVGTRQFGRGREHFCNDPRLRDAKVLRLVEQWFNGTIKVTL